MTENEIKAIELGISRIRGARQAVTDAERKLKLVNDRISNKTQWTVSLELEKRDAYSYHPPTVEFTIPMQMVQQQLADALRRAKSALVEAESFRPMVAAAGEGT